MKNFTTILSILLLIGLCSFTINSNNHTAIGNGERVEVIFNSSVKFNDLVKIKLDLAEMGITIEYRKIEFNESGALQSIYFEVDCHDGFSGSAGMRQLNDDEKFGFFRDYSEHCISPFGTGNVGNIKCD